MGEIPRLSHLQFLVIGAARGGTVPGREIRERLHDFGVRKSGPAFYQLMARLEDAGMVDGSYHQEIVEGQIIRERHYRVTAAGTRAWEASRTFYVEAIRGFGGAEGLARGTAGA
ncbi:MAG: helix-turn-helix transcriptional regulator [Gemmatimonadota bacterium]